MTLNFYIRFYTNPGEQLYVFGTSAALGSNDSANAIPLEYQQDGFWYGQVDLGKEGTNTIINYAHVFRGAQGNEIIEGGNDRIIDLKKTKAKEIILVDTWNHAGDIRNAFYSKPFQEVLFGNENTIDKAETAKQYTFKVKTPLLGKEETLCIIGSGKTFGNWQTAEPILLSKEGNWWTTSIDLEDKPSLIEYKYGIYDIKQKKFSHFEGGGNRRIKHDADKNKWIIVHDGFVQFSAPAWKGAGVATPVFSLRTKSSFGTGEFLDIKLLVDWAKQSGLKLIQLLPINDTTATHTSKDSYPYAAISAFALHPLYLNLEKVAGSKHSAIIEPFTKKQQALNALPVLDYDEVANAKFSIIDQLYPLQKEELKTDPGYASFFAANAHWLVPYAAFCYLRDKYKTADCTQWKTYSQYNESAIQKLSDPTQKHHDAIAVHYFIQYHLHLQLKEATDHAHANGIVVKGDLPIGIFRYSCDAWVAPDQYNMELQAGAPPDDFSVKGQNWGFPTYNWKKMQEDGYAWWRQRFQQMSTYFDAFRIDHILGFFRIWSMALDAVEGILGRFDPAVPIHINELYHQGISFHPYRYCKPYIDEDVLIELFGLDVPHVKKIFLTDVEYFYELREEFDTQRKVEAYFEQLPVSDDNIRIKQGLYDLISNIIFIEEDGSQMQQFHFRINMQETSSFRKLDEHSKNKLRGLYIDYFYRRQDDLWKKEAMKKLPQLKRSTNMLVCGEDLGMVPHCVPEVMHQLGLLSLEIQRMPKHSGVLFSNINDAPYLSVVAPSTHDMSTIRGWWEENPEHTQFFYNTVLGHSGAAPRDCEPFINKQIIEQHLQSPAMWSIFQLQDLLGMEPTLRRGNPNEERINIPADPHHYWRYRMHIGLEELIEQNQFNEEIKGMVTASGR